MNVKKDPEFAINNIIGLAYAILGLSCDPLIDDPTTNALYGLGYTILEQAEYLLDEYVNGKSFADYTESGE